MKNFNTDRDNSQFIFFVAIFIAITKSYLFWPGVYTWEVIQFEKLRELPVINDWKSPFVAGLFGLSKLLFKSYGPVLLFQQILFWIGLAFIASCSFSRLINQMLFVIVIGILPPIWITEILLWKEAWTLSFFCLSIGAIFFYFHTGKISSCILSVLSSIALAATRQNTIILAIPSIFIASNVLVSAFSSKNNKRLFSQGIIFLLLLFFTLFSVWFVNIRGKEKCHIWHHALLWDLAGISLSEDVILIPEAFFRDVDNFSKSTLYNHYTSYHSDPLFFYERSPLKLFGTPWTGCPSTPPLDVLIKSWKAAIYNYPLSYLIHRYNYNLRLLGIPDSSKDKFGSIYYRIDSEYVAKINQSKIFSMMYESALYEYLVKGILGKGWVYLVIFLASGFSLKFKSSKINNYLKVLWLAGIAYFLSFSLIGSGALIRYLTIYGILGPAILAGRRMIQSNKVYYS